MTWFIGMLVLVLFIFIIIGLSKMLHAFDTDLISFAFGCAVLIFFFWITWRIPEKLGSYVISQYETAKYGKSAKFK